jgi:hypothetical protein
MAKSAKQAVALQVDLLAPPATSPLVFISHDSRDADIAEAFSKLLKSVSAGMIRTFRSSDKKGKDGIDFGDEWYKRLMEKLQSTSDVVCLFSERSLDRPWILFEAGVAKGKLGTPVIGLAVGVPLSRISTGPFYQFQNLDDSAEELTKLVHQLAQRVPNCELDNDVVKVQVAAFKTAEAAILAKLEAGGARSEKQEESESAPLAKLVEEMKALPSRVADRLSESGEPFRRRRMRRFHPMMFEEMMHMSGEPGDPVAILMAASLVRDDAPWLYELAMEVYRAVRVGDPETIGHEIKRLRNFSELTMRGPFMEEFGLGKESHIFLMEFPRMLEHMLRRTLERTKTTEPEPEVRPRTPGASSLRAAARKQT